MRHICSVLCVLFLAVGVLERLLALDGGVAIATMQLALVLGCVGVPAPEEAVYATAGFLSATGRVAPWPAFFACWATLWVLDGVAFEIGRRLGRGVRTSRLGRRVPRRRWAWIRKHMARHGVGTVVAARFVMGLRLPTFLLAGASRMPRGRFWLASGLGGLFSGGIPFALGWILTDTLPDLLQGLAAGKWALAALVLVGILAAWVLKRRGTREPTRG